MLNCLGSGRKKVRLGGRNDEVSEYGRINKIRLNYVSIATRLVTWPCDSLEQNPLADTIERVIIETLFMLGMSGRLALISSKQ